MTRDKMDCICPGATHRERVDAEGEVVRNEDGTPVVEWQSNDPRVKCPVHPRGYDPKTGKNG